jgi:hypothetical protein
VLPDKSTRLIVLDGVVQLQNAQGSVSVGPGEAAIAALGKAPSKIFLTQAPGREQMLYHVGARDIFSMVAPTRGLETSPSGADARRGARKSWPSRPRRAARRIGSILPRSGWPSTIAPRSSRPWRMPGRRTVER